MGPPSPLNGRLLGGPPCLRPRRETNRVAKLTHKSCPPLQARLSLTDSYLYVIMESGFCMMTAAAIRTNSNRRDDSRRQRSVGPPPHNRTNLIDTLPIRKRRKSRRLNRSEFLIDTNSGEFRSRSSPQFRATRLQLAHRGGILIDNLPIRIRPNPRALNKNPISNRREKGISLKSQRQASRLQHPEPNRNSQELKLNVTP